MAPKAVERSLALRLSELSCFSVFYAIKSLPKSPRVPHVPRDPLHSTSIFTHVILFFFSLGLGLYISAFHNLCTVNDSPNGHDNEHVGIRRVVASCVVKPGSHRSSYSALTFQSRPPFALNEPQMLCESSNDILTVMAYEYTWERASLRFRCFEWLAFQSTDYLIKPAGLPRHGLHLRLSLPSVL